MIKPEGDKLTLYEVEAFTTALLWHIEGHENIEIDFTDIEQLDMSAIQLLISSKLYAQKEHKTFQISNISSEISELFVLSGASRVLGISHG